MMKRIAALFITIFLAVFVLGCAEEIPVKPTATPVETPTPTPTPTPAPTAPEEEILNVTIDDLAEVENLLNDLKELEDIQFDI